jgi:hypothetical protein
MDMRRRTTIVAVALFVTAAMKPGVGFPMSSFEGKPTPGFLGQQAPKPAPAPQNPADAAIVAEFERRVQEYVALHEKQEGTLPRLPKDAEAAAIDQHQRALERLIATARANAKPGDIFGPQMAGYVKRVLKPVFSGPRGQQNRALVWDADEKIPSVPLKVNMRYPDDVPLSTMPPDVLQVLPHINELSTNHELKYYFIGRHLVLLDVHAHIIVDFVENAMSV